MKKFLIGALFLISFFAKAEIVVDSKLSAEIFKSIDIISKIEDLPIIKESTLDNQTIKSFAIDDISCVFEMYNACSFFTDINGTRKLVVSMEGSQKFMQALVDAGIQLDEDNARLDVEKVECQKSNTETSCTLTEFIP